jgi:flagellar biosynthesis GTPase FlhF
VAYVSEGQRVPEDLAPARSHSLVSRCVGVMQQTRTALAKQPVRYRKAAVHA